MAITSENRHSSSRAQEEYPTSTNSEAMIMASSTVDRSINKCTLKKLPCAYACDACPLCQETCDDRECLSCSDAPYLVPSGFGRCVPSYTLCQVRRHCHAGSAWIVAGDTVYDITTYLQQHPGGTQCLLKKAGGASDCTVDLNFHSTRGRRVWKKYEIGKLRACSNETDLARDWWMFWR